MKGGGSDLRAAEMEWLDHLLATMANPGDIDAAIHETRKGVKRLRAHLRLTRGAIDPAAYRGRDDDLRSIGLILAPARDAFVLSLTLEGLESSEGWGPAGDFIKANHQAAIDEVLAGPVDEVVRILTAVRERWPRVGDVEATVITNSLARSYRRGRLARDDAVDGEHTGEFHRWRKLVKYLRYQLEAVGGDAAVVASLTELGEWLGLEHDHTVFIEFCDDEINLLPDRRDRYVLIDRAETRRAELRAASLATTVFTQEPEAFVSTLIPFLA